MSPDNYIPFNDFLNKVKALKLNSTIKLLYLHQILGNTYFQKNNKYKKYSQNRLFSIENKILSWNSHFKQYSFDLNKIEKGKPLVKEHFRIKTIAYGRKKIKEIESIWLDSHHILAFIINIIKRNKKGIPYQHYYISIDKDKNTLFLYSKMRLKYQLIGHQYPVISIYLEENILISSDVTGVVKIWNLKKLAKNQQIQPILNLYFDKIDWLIWNNEYQYASNLRGCDYFGFSIKNNKTKKKKFHSLKFLKNQLYNKQSIINIIKKDFS